LPLGQRVSVNTSSAAHSDPTPAWRKAEVPDTTKGSRAKAQTSASAVGVKPQRYIATANTAKVSSMRAMPTPTAASDQSAVQVAGFAPGAVRGLGGLVMPWSSTAAAKKPEVRLGIWKDSASQ